MERPRVLDDQAVEAAEFARKNGRLEVAVEMSAVGLGMTSSPITAEEVTLIVPNRPQLVVLACLSRIYVDSLKSLANQVRTPWTALPYLDHAARAIRVVYDNPAVNYALEGVGQDHRGREHFFLPEMVRDRAKTLVAASFLYGKTDAHYLCNKASTILKKTALQLPDDHPVKPLIVIEKEMIEINSGGEIHFTELYDNFAKLVDSDMEKNPNRVAVVAAWMTILGEKIADSKLERDGQRVFNRATETHPEWKFILDAERKKSRMQDLRRKSFWVMSETAAVFNLYYRDQRTDLYDKLMGVLIYDPSRA